MLFDLALALTDPRDIHCVRSIVDTMSFSFSAEMLEPDTDSIVDRLGGSRVDLLIMEINDQEAEQLSFRLRAEKPGLWMILLKTRENGPEAERRDAKTIVLAQPVSTMRMLHAMHTAAVSLAAEKGG